MKLFKLPGKFQLFSSQSLAAKENPEVYRLNRVLFIYGIIGIVILLVMTIITFRSDEYFYSLITFTFSLMLICSLLVLKLAGKPQITAYLYAFIMISLNFFLISVGGIDNYGPLWIYIFFPLIYYTLEIKQGSIAIAIIIASQLIIFYLPKIPESWAVYSSAFKIRYLISEIGVILISFAAEWSRFRIQQTMNQVYKEMEQRSITDELTQINNRRGGLEKINYLKDLNERIEGYFTFLFIDLDHFKNINDQFGHNAGDLILKETAKILKETIRKQDIAIRWGGEEFLIVLPHTENNEATYLAERIRSKFENHQFRWGENKISLTVSCGIANCSKDQDIDDSIKRADSALYRAKENGRNCIKAD